jgi:metallo-beta-lactamase family protein
VPDAVYLVHGEPRSAQTLAARIRTELGWVAVVAGDSEIVRLDASQGYCARG